MKNYFYSIVTLFLFFSNASAQVLTHEDSLAAGLIANNSVTVISGYGNARYSNNLTEKTAEANIDRFILFVGHKFTNKISFFSELELEDAKVAGGEVGGEFSIEQAFMKFNINHFNYVTTGLFIPRIGIINENHLPNTFNGNDRPFVEKYVIPATWREIGVGYYGTSLRIPGLNYSCALMNGLNSAAFESGSGIRSGRFEGREANARALAITGALLYYVKNFRFQTSAYLGGSSGLTKYDADSLGLKNKAFSTPVELIEANMQYHNKGISFKALAAFVNIPDADKINAAYANNTANQLFGAYAELGYNILRKTDKNLTVFARYEQLNMNVKLPSNGIEDQSINRQYLVGGITFQPHKGVSIKLDYYNRITGDVNPLLVSTPFPASQPFYRSQHFINLGFGYSF